MLLNVKNLSVSRGGRLLLSGVNFDLPKGEMILLKGPNGLGKTSLLRTLAGEVYQKAGAILDHCSARVNRWTVDDRLAKDRDVERRNRLRKGQHLRKAVGYADLICADIGVR